MNARNRRSARRRAIKKRFPVGIWLICHATIENRARASYNGDWCVYGYKGQSLKVRRQGMSAGYTATPRELGQ